MAKRIVSGIFILTALGALGVILAGAMTSGEQLIVRFLTAVTVAALALYVVSDLRLQSEQAEPRPEPLEPGARTPAPQTTTEVMATVTGPSHAGRRPEPAMEPTVPRPNHEPVGAAVTPVRAAGVEGPTAPLTGSRLVPLPEPARAGLVRTTSPPHPSPPHPSMSHATDRSSAHPVTTPDPLMIDSDEQARASLPEDGETWTTTPPAEDSTIASTSFAYSGKLDSAGVDWPRKRPVEETTDTPTAGYGPASGDRVVDEPTAELPELRSLSEELPPHGEERAPYLFAVDTLDSDEILDLSETHDEFRPVPPRLDAEPADTGPIDLIDLTGPVEVDDLSDLISVESTEPAVTERRSWALDGESPPATPPSPTERRITAAHYTTPAPLELLDPTESGDLAGGHEPVVSAPSPSPSASRSSSPSAPAIRENNHADRLSSALRAGEIQVISSLIAQGMLSTDGPITDRDVRTMVYVAFTSNELRKLILAGGTPDGVRAGDLDLGPVELFDESRYAPAPKLLYSGTGTGSSNDVIDAEPVLDLTAMEEPVDSSSDVDVSNDVDVSSDEASDFGDLGDGGDAEPPELVPTLPTPRNLYRITEAEASIQH